MLIQQLGPKLIKKRKLGKSILIAIKSEFNFRVNGQYSSPLIVIIPNGKIVFSCGLSG